MWLTRFSENVASLGIRGCKELYLLPVHFLVTLQRLSGEGGSKSGSHPSSNRASLPMSSFQFYLLINWQQTVVQYSLSNIRPCCLVKDLLLSTNPGIFSVSKTTFVKASKMDSEFPPGFPRLW